MILRIFGKEAREQIRGLVGTAFLLILGAILFMLVAQPQWGLVQTTSTQGWQVISLLFSALMFFAGYLANDLKKAKKKEPETRQQPKR